MSPDNGERRSARLKSKTTLEDSKGFNEKVGTTSQDLLRREQQEKDGGSLSGVRQSSSKEVRRSARVKAHDALGNPKSSDEGSRVSFEALLSTDTNRDTKRKRGEVQNTVLSGDLLSLEGGASISQDLPQRKKFSGKEYMAEQRKYFYILRGYFENSYKKYNIVLKTTHKGKRVDKNEQLLQQVKDLLMEQNNNDAQKEVENLNAMDIEELVQKSLEAQAASSIPSDQLLRIRHGQGIRGGSREKYFFKEQYRKMCLLRWYFEEKYKQYNISLWSGARFRGKMHQIQSLEQIIRQVEYKLLMLEDDQAQEEAKQLKNIDIEHLLTEANEAFQEAGISIDDLKRGYPDGKRVRQEIDNKEVGYVFNKVKIEKPESEKPESDSEQSMPQFVLSWEEFEQELDNFYGE